MAHDQCVNFIGLVCIVILLLGVTFFLPGVILALVRVLLPE